MSKKLNVTKHMFHIITLIFLLLFSSIVNVNAEEAESTKVTIENAYAVVGREVEVLVGFAKGTGVGAYELNIAYDNNALEFVKGESLIQTLAWDANDNGNSTYVTGVLATDIQNDTYLQVMRLTFRVKGEALEGSYPLYITEGIMVSGQTGEGVFFDISDGVINVSEKLIGDVDENAKINIADAMMVFRYVAGKDVEAKEVIEQNGDVNGDGGINIIDAMMLFHYVSDRIDSFVQGSKNDVENEPMDDNNGEVIESDSIESTEVTTRSESSSINPDEIIEQIPEELTTNKQQVTDETTRKPENTTEKETSKEEKPTTEKETAVEVSGISLDKTDVSMNKGAMLVLRTTVSPSNANNKSVTWSSSNTSVATVSNNGRVMAVGNGTATITVKTNDSSKMATCKVTVITSVTIVELDKTSISLNKGDSATLTATVMPAAANNKAVTWSSSNTSVATVNSSGKITAVGNGTATITVKTADGGKTASCTVTVKTPITGVSLNKTSVSLNKGGTTTLAATVSPSTASNKTVTWSSSNTAVATVSSSGKITAVGNGTTTITVKTADGGKTASCTVTVSTAVTTAVTGVSLNKTSVSLNKGGTTILTATVNPSTANNKSVTWSSSNTSVAKVNSSGVVTAVNNGTAIITVKTADGSKTATCTVTVTTTLTKINIVKDKVFLDVNDSSNKTYQCEYAISPTTASNKNVTWASSDTSIATVDSTGKITAKKIGKTTITVTTRDGNKTDTVSVFVYESNAEPRGGGNWWLKISTYGNTNLVMTESGKNVYLNKYAGTNEQLWQFGDYTKEYGGMTLSPRSRDLVLKPLRIGGNIKATCSMMVWDLTADPSASVWQVLRLWDETYVFKLTDTKGNEFAVGTTSVKEGTQLTLVDFDFADVKQRWNIEGVQVIPVTGVSLNKTSVELKKDTTITLTATVSPNTASNKSVTWSSSNTAVATVDSNGKVTAKGNGTATITVKTADGGKTATCKVTVTTAVTGVSITNKKNVALDIKGTYQCKISISPSTASNKAVTWSSSDSSVASVDSTGKITGLNPGIATITVKTVDGAKTDKINVYVYKTNAEIRGGGNWWLKMKLARTNLYMDVVNGNAYEGAKVQLASPNDSNAQLWQFVDYLSTYGGVGFKPRCSTVNLGLDVHRGGTSYDDPLKVGLKIDLWTLGEDKDASTWTIVKLWDDSYILKLKGTDYAVGTTSATAGMQLTLVKFDVWDTNQRWFIEGVQVTSSSGGTTGNVSRTEAVTWANNKIGTRTDTDYMYGAQCKDLVNKYTQELFGYTFDGNANDLIYCTLPSGWTRIKNTPDFVPQPGDIALWDAWPGNEFGHTGIIVSANINSFYSIDQNWYNFDLNNGSEAAKVCHDYESHSFWGVLRPPLKD